MSFVFCAATLRHPTSAANPQRMAIAVSIAAAVWVAIVALFAGVSEAQQDGLKPSELARGTVTFQRQPEGVWFYEGSQRIFFHQHATKSFNGEYARANYLHPLYSLDGVELTEDFPSDHKHHRGVFWAWHQTLADGKRMGDAWATQRFGWKVSSCDVRQRPDGSAVLKAVVQWTSPDHLPADSPFAEEHLTLTVFPERQDARLIDLQIRICPLVAELAIGGSENVKGYGGFSVRVRCPDDIRFVSESGELTPQVAPVPGGDWLDISATFGAKRSGITILADRRRPSIETSQLPWILRTRSSMQNAAFPGRDPLTIRQDSPLTLHYGLLVHRGELTRERARVWKARFLNIDGELTDRKAAPLKETP